MQKTYGDLGITLPRVAAEQQHASIGTSVPSLADAQPGDLLFFGNPAYHVAIYMGDNKLIESPEPGKTVHITDVYQQPTTIKRIVDSSSAAPATVATGGLDAAALQSAGLNAAVAEVRAAVRGRGGPVPLADRAARRRRATGVGRQHLARSARPAPRGSCSSCRRPRRAIGVDPDNPDQAIGAAAKILAGNLHHFDSVPLALAAYNAGAGAVEQYHGIPPYAETQNYVRSITAMMAAGG